MDWRRLPPPNVPLSFENYQFAKIATLRFVRGLTCRVCGQMQASEDKGLSSERGAKAGTNAGLRRSVEIL
jgi:hypothetical protein